MPAVGIIGAGVCGLLNALNLYRTHERLNDATTLSVTLFDLNTGPGGTWSADSVYDHLITNNSWSQMLADDDGQAKKLFESDPALGAGPGGFRATGEAMTIVMEHLARQVTERGAVIHYETEVTSVVEVPCADEGAASPSWLLTTSPHATHTFTHLIVATGSFSQPALPSFATPYVLPYKAAIAPEDYTRPLVIHTCNLSAPSVQAAIYSRKERRVCVVGASKSALDASERLALNGYSVTQVMKNPPYLAPPCMRDPDTGTPQDAAFAVGTRRTTSYVPYFRDPVSGQLSGGGWLSSLFRYCLHYSALTSSWLFGKLVAKSMGMYAAIGRWARLPDMVPQLPLMWSESCIFPTPEKLQDVLEEGKVSVVRGFVTALEPANDGYSLTISENSGQESHIEADLVIFGTGWRTGEYPFFAPELHQTLGLPVSGPIASLPREDAFAESDAAALRHLSTVRTLRNEPEEFHDKGFASRSLGKTEHVHYGYRLYRLMVPYTRLHQRNIAFAGIPTCKANHVIFLVQAHWIADYFFGLLPRFPTDDEAKAEISLQNMWSRRLFGPSHGRYSQWLGASWIEYNSRLCWDMKVPDDGCGLTGIITSDTYGHLEQSRRARDGCDTKLA